jgi:hypothetical protein
VAARSSCASKSSTVIVSIVIARSSSSRVRSSGDHAVGHGLVQLGLEVQRFDALALQRLQELALHRLGHDRPCSGSC